MKFAQSWICVLVLASGLLAGVALAGGSIDVSGSWSRATPPGIEVGVAYFMIENHGEADRLISTSTPIAKRAELHTHIKEGDLVKMRKLEAVDIQAGEPVMFEPGGKHVMLTGLQKALKEGESFPLTLMFEKAGSVELEVTVQGVDAMPAEQKTDHSGHSGMDRSNLDPSEKQHTE